jgi:adenylate cyclase
MAAIVFVILDVFRFLCLQDRRNAAIGESVVIVLQVSVVFAFFILPPPFGLHSSVAARIAFDTPLFILLMCLLASNAVAARPVLVWVNGLAILGLWVAMWRYVVDDKHILTSGTIHLSHYKTMLSLLTATNDVNYFNFGLWWKGGVISSVLITGAFGLSLFRTRRLANAGARQEVRRQSLAAFFSPQLVDVILRERNDGLAPREQTVAVLDCDLVGFTRLAELLPLEKVTEALQLYRTVVEDEVFNHGGAILSHIGDGSVALFGLTEGSAQAGPDAFACALAIARKWPASADPEFGAALPRLAIGVDFGPAFVGLAGTDRTFSLLAIGPAVAGASLLQQETRASRAQILVSESLKAMLHEPTADGILELFVFGGTQAWQLVPR